MIRVTVELIPHGKEAESKTVSVIEIFNTLEKFSEEKYVYGYKALIKHKADMEEITGKVVHNRKYIVFHLIEDVITDVQRQALGVW